MMEKPVKKKILFVNNSLGQGGAEKALIELLKVLDPEEFDIYLYLMVNRGEYYSVLPSYVTPLQRGRDCRSVLSRQGQRACILRVARCALCRGSLFKNISYLHKNRRSFRRLGRKTDWRKLSWRLISDGARPVPREFDMAVAYIEGGATYFVADHVKAKYKAAFVHTHLEQAGYTPELNGDCYDRIQKIYTVSEFTRDGILALHPEQAGKIEIFHNILNVQEIRERAEEPGFQDGFSGMRLVTLGRLTPEKAYDVAIPALARVLREFPETRWYVLGEGNERDALEALAAEQGVSGNFILLGSRENPYPYLREADVYVHATRYEGRSVALEEARVLGKPILASNIPSNREQITEGVDGLLTELTPQALAENISLLLRDPALRQRLGEAAGKGEFPFERDVEAFLAPLREKGGKLPHEKEAGSHFDSRL